MMISRFLQDNFDNGCLNRDLPWAIFCICQVYVHKMKGDITTVKCCRVDKFDRLLHSHNLVNVSPLHSPDDKFACRWGCTGIIWKSLFVCYTLNFQINGIFKADILCCHYAPRISRKILRMKYFYPVRNIRMLNIADARWCDETLLSFSRTTTGFKIIQ